MQKLTLKKYIKDSKGFDLEPVTQSELLFKSLKEAKIYVDSLIEDGKTKMKAGSFTSVSHNNWYEFSLPNKKVNEICFTFFTEDKQFIHSAEIEKA